MKLRLYPVIYSPLCSLTGIFLVSGQPTERREKRMLAELVSDAGK
jgi:hypothetical protein